MLTTQTLDPHCPPHPEEKGTTAKSGGLVGGLLFQRVRPLDALAQRINEQQYMIVQHSKSMLEAARIAGEALIEAKKQITNGQFKDWIEKNTNVSRAQAYRYMDVAKNWDSISCLTRETPELTLRAALEAIGKAVEKPTAPASNLPTFTEDDAEYALKIAARMNSEFEGEREVAKAKLEKLAKGHLHSLVMP